MHSCLSVAEILSTIFHDIPSNQDLYTLAIVCKTFQGPALDVLWESRASLKNLLCTFPANSWKVNFTRPKSLSFTRPLQPTDFDRDGVIEPSVFYAIEMAIQIFCLSAPLLPNLRTLCCEAHKPDDAWNARIFIGPNLTKFELHINTHAYPDMDHLSILTALKATSPLLRELSVKSYVGSEALVEVLSDVFAHMKHLQNVSVDCDAFAVFQRLRKFPPLSALTVSFPPLALDTPTQYSIMSERSFPYLKFFTSPSMVLRAANKFLHIYCQSSPWKKVDIQLKDKVTSQLVLDLFSNLLNQYSMRSLTSISIQINLKSPRDAQIAADALETSTYIPLLEFVNLEVVAITTGYLSIAWDDNMLQKMALAWPQLRVLDLSVSSSSELPKATLQGIMAFARHCRWLSQLAVAITVEKPLGAGQLGRPGGGVCRESLNDLKMGLSPILDSRYAAEVLSDIFPNAKISHSCRDVWSSRESAWYKRWDEAKLLFQSFVDIRRQERAWAAGAGIIIKDQG